MTCPTCAIFRLHLQKTGVRVWRHGMHPSDSLSRLDTAQVWRLFRLPIKFWWPNGRASALPVSLGCTGSPTRSATALFGDKAVVL